MKFIEELCTKKYVLVKEMFTNAPNMSLPLQAQVKKTDDGLETLKFSVEENVAGVEVSKGVNSDSLLKHERLIAVNLPEKSSTVTNDYFSQLLRHN